MRWPRALVKASLLSALLHLAVLMSAGWQLPEKREAIRIEARLLNPASEVTPAAAAPVPKAAAPRLPPRRKAAQQENAPQASLPEVSSAAEPTKDPLADASAPLASAPAVATSEALASEAVARGQSEPLDGVKNRSDLSAWATQGRVSFDAGYGSVGLPAGEAEHRWTHDERGYEASLAMRSGGLLRLAYRYDAQQWTTGRIVGNSLLVTRYTEQANTRRFDSVFDLAAGIIRQNRNGDLREVEAQGVVLDIQSLLHFLAAQPVDVEAFDIFVVSPRASVSRVTVVQRPAQRARLPVGDVVVRRFIAEARGGDLHIEVDLAPGWRNAPVRIYIEDRKQELKLELRASEIEIEGLVLARREHPPNIDTD